ncbi:uncharacterized protein [Oscarella lobularis]|uniref:uncharacterized protein n=1 Tax=Oscarella lobularis TaxID=121494 RepID=UPI0033143035
MNGKWLKTTDSKLERSQKSERGFRSMVRLSPYVASLRHDGVAKSRRWRFDWSWSGRRATFRGEMAQFLRIRSRFFLERISIGWYARDERVWWPSVKFLSEISTRKLFGFLYIFATLAKCLPFVGSSRDFLSGLSDPGVVDSQSVSSLVSSGPLGPRKRDRISFGRVAMSKTIRIPMQMLRPYISC